MDLSRYPLEKIFHFAAGFIPGLAALLIFEAAHPGGFRWFFGLGFLGYRTKLVAILLAAFVLGNTMSEFLTFLAEAVGRVIGYATPYRPSQLYAVAPCRDPGWRVLVQDVIGPAALADVQLMTPELYDFRLKLLESVPESERKDAAFALLQERAEAVMNDQCWQHWYDHYHQLIVQRADHSFESYVRTGLAYNLQTAAVYYLIFAATFPAIRRRWCILPACMWVVIFAGEIYGAWTRFGNRWSTFQEQLAYLSALRQTRGSDPFPPQRA